MRTDLMWRDNAAPRMAAQTRDALRRSAMLGTMAYGAGAAESGVAPGPYAGREKSSKKMSKPVTQARAKKTKLRRCST